MPLIKDELESGDEAGLEHYRRAGEMLLEARDQLSGGSWTQWLTRNFALSRMTAWRYMRLAERAPDVGAWRPLRDFASHVNLTALTQEQQARGEEVRLHRELAEELIEIGYRALATRLHPDRGRLRCQLDGLGRRGAR